MLRGDPTDSFNKIPEFFYILQQTNLGTVTGLQIDGHSRFKYCFMALGASIRGLKHCRPVVVVDETYLNGHYGRTLFTACIQDANNSVFVLAFRIGDNENDRSWSWFFGQLKKAYGDREGLCFVSDRHNSIRKAIENVIAASRNLSWDMFVSSPTKSEITLRKIMTKHNTSIQCSCSRLHTVGIRI